jgi:hypothetical protein
LRQVIQVCINNLPTHQLLQGRINRVRIAGRSLQLRHRDIHEVKGSPVVPRQGLFDITALELETDAIELDIHNRTRKQPKLKQPLQVGL